MALDPHCLVSDGVSLYTAFFGYNASTSKDYQLNNRPDLVLARSNPYPAGKPHWTVVSKVENFEWDISQAHNYLCAWNPDYESVVMFVRPFRYRPELEGYNFDLPVNVTVHDPSYVKWTYSKEEYGQEAGRSVLLYNDPRTGGNPAYRWIQIRFDKKNNQLVFAYFGKAMTPYIVQESRWDMDVARTGSNLILTHSNNTLYALGLKNADTHTYTISEIPLDTAKIPLTKPSTIRTTDTIIEGGCDLTHSQTSMHADKGTVYILCKPSREIEQPVDLYRFNGTSTEYLGQIPTKSDAGTSIFYQWIPVPRNGSASTWGYFHGLGGQAKLMTYSNDNLNYTVVDDMLDVGYYMLRGTDGYPDNSKVPEFIPITIGIVAAIVILTVLSYFYYRRSHRCATGDIPLTTVSPGGRRDVYGENASGDLPKYEMQSATDQVPQSLVRHGTTGEPPEYSVSVPLNLTSVTADGTAIPMATSTVTLNPSASGGQTSAST
ncbi:hypothetical protein BGX34_004529 [Mortierella sp. NVP85]|nr:hypothetical protein BGX34_004529 [Mortierella sp. NVP85]